jgi:endoglucanase
MKSCLKKFLLIASAISMFCFTGVTVNAAEAGYGELISKSTFSVGDGVPWQVFEANPAKADFDIKDGKYNITVENPGLDRWDVMFCYRDFVIEKGHTYTVKFTVSASRDCSIYAKIGDISTPYNEYWNYKKNWELINLKANVPQTISDYFTMTLDTKRKCEFAFHISDPDSSGKLPYTVSFEDISLTDPQYGSVIVPREAILGDVNGDKVIDALDLALVKKFVMAQEGVFINIRVADVNGDGSVNAIDYALIKQYLLGKITVFPAEI